MNSYRDELKSTNKYFTKIGENLNKMGYKYVKKNKHQIPG